MTWGQREPSQASPWPVGPLWSRHFLLLPGCWRRGLVGGGEEAKVNPDCASLQASPLSSARLGRRGLCRDQARDGQTF